MQKIYLDVVSEDKEEILKIQCNDKYFNYITYRKFLSEEICIDLINSAKKTFNKKAAIIFGNCQTGQLAKILINNPTFYKNYFIIQLPMVCDYNDLSLKYFQENFWSVCDLFISHHVNENNRFSPLLATKKLSERLPIGASIIFIPNVYFDGYFPQITKNLHNVDLDKHQSGRFPYGDKYVDQFLNNAQAQGGGVNLENLTNYIKMQNFISESEVIKQIQNSFQALEQREISCNIKMSDIVEARYKKEQIFYSPNHPTQDILIELAKRILKFMDINDVDFENINVLLDVRDSLMGQDIPIYPKVKEILNLENSLEKFFPNRFLWSFKGDYLEFLIEYAKWCWKDKINF